MEITQEEKNRMSPFMSDLWQVIKRYYKPDPDPDSPYWPELMQAAEQIVNKSGNHRLAQKLTLAFLDYVEEVAHGRP